MDAIYHARSSVKKWGGTENDYLPIHLWFDESSDHIDDSRHRAYRHHSFGVKDAVEKFGRLLPISTGREVPVKQIAERHIQEDLGFIPTLADWIRSITPERWMRRKIIRRIRF